MRAEDHFRASSNFLPTFSAILPRSGPALVADPAVRRRVVQAWALEVSADGSFVLSGGHDRSLRMWRRTEEMVFLEEERERELEGLFEAELDRDNVAGFAPPSKPVGGVEGADRERK